MSAAENLPEPRVEIRVIAPDSRTYPGTMLLFGRSHEHCATTSSWFARDIERKVSFQLSLHGTSWSLRASHHVGEGLTNVEVAVQAATPELCEQEWLEVASNEAPRLCALVVDGMDPAGEVVS